MSERAENLILEYLRAMRSDMAIIKQDVKALQLRVTSLEVLVATVVSDLLRLNGASMRRTIGSNASRTVSA